MSLSDRERAEGFLRSVHYGTSTTCFSFEQERAEGFLPLSICYVHTNQPSND